MTPHRFITSQSPSPVLRENLHKVGKINKGNRRTKQLWQNAVPAPDEPAAEGFPFVWRPSASSCALRVLLDFFFIGIFPPFLHRIKEHLLHAGRLSAFLRRRDGNLMFRAAVNSYFYCRSLLISVNVKKKCNVSLKCFICLIGTA